MLFKNKEEFKDIFDRFYNPLCNYVHRIIEDSNTVEDVVQEMFVHLWASKDALNLPDSKESYLFKAAKNKALEHIRAQKSYNKAIEQSKLISYEADSHSKMAGVYLKMEKISRLLRHLPPKCRNVFVLHKYNGLTYAEIAEAEAISVKTVENHMLKALKFLRENLKSKISNR